MKQNIYILISQYIGQNVMSRISTYIIYMARCISYLIEKNVLHKTVKVATSPQLARKRLQKIWPERIVRNESSNKPVDSHIDVSIIVPVFNSEEDLMDMIESVLDQETEYKYELILVDDGSGSAAKQILKQYVNISNVRVIEQENKGISAARNTGINNAVGKYLFFLDCDDSLKANCLQTLLNEAYKSEHDIIMAGHTLVKVKDDVIITKRDYIYSNKNLECYKDGDEIMNYSGLPWGKLYKRELFYEIRFPVGYWYEDTIIQFLVFRKAKSYSYLPISLYNYKWHEGNYSKIQSKSSDRVLEHLWIIDQMLLENQRIGLSKDAILYKTTLRHLGSYLYGAIKNMPETVQEDAFAVGCEILEKVSPNEKYHLNFQLKQLEEAYKKHDFKQWKLASSIL